jgi:hypothetical protein
MFKYGSIEDEIYRSMEKQLVAEQVEKKHGFNKLAKAADYLNAAASLFEQAGMSQEAKETTMVLYSLAMENLSVSDLAGLSEKDLHNVLEMSTPAQLFSVVKKVSNVATGESSFWDEVKSALKTMDLSDPGVRSAVVSKIVTGLKLAKFFV